MAEQELVRMPRLAELGFFVKVKDKRSVHIGFQLTLLRDAFHKAKIFGLTIWNFYLTAH